MNDAHVFKAFIDLLIALHTSNPREEPPVIFWPEHRLLHDLLQEHKKNTHHDHPRAESMMRTADRVARDLGYL